MRVETVCLGELDTNCYLINEGGKTILIDPAQSCEALSSFLAGRSVDLVVNTHGHFDHIGAIGTFRSAGRSSSSIRLHYQWLITSTPIIRNSIVTSRRVISFPVDCA